jgi:hypothetical protein
MAKVDVFRSADETFLFYNLDAAVGKGCANRRDDVLLVQYLLKASSNVPGTIRIEVRGIDQSPPGVWGNFDDALLKAEQSDWIERGKSIWQDGRVDPVPPQQQSLRTPVHQAQYTILTLNAIYQHVRPTDYTRMAQATDCPAELAQRIRAPKWIGS